MPIDRVKTEGDYIYIYNEKGYLLTQMFLNGKTFVDYNDTSFTLKDDSWRYIYDEQGHLISEEIIN